MFPNRNQFFINQYNCDVMRNNYVIILLLVMMLGNVAHSQEMDMSKLSQGVVTVMEKYRDNQAKWLDSNTQPRKLMALMSLSEPSLRSGFLADYGIEVVDSIGRVYIVNAP